MGKQGKSSATSATRKKHQKKANPLDPSISIAPASKSQGKGKGKKNKEPRVKQYVRPAKFKPLVEDPIDNLATTGLLPPNMVLCFRGLSKKDPVTKTKALEDLFSMIENDAWFAALPVWLWHFVPLSVHPSRRIRELNAALHAKLLARSDLQEELQTLMPSHSDSGSLLAAWMLGANDVVPSISSTLRSSWNASISWQLDTTKDGLLNIQDQLVDLVASVVQAVLAPNILYQQFTPLAAATNDNIDKTDVLNAYEQPEDRDARLRTSGLGAMAWILEMPSSVARPHLVPVLSSVLSSDPLFGSVLSAVESAGFLSGYTTTQDGVPSLSFGYSQRAVRIAGWGVVRVLVNYIKEDFSSTEALKPIFLSSLGIAALRSAWVEPDAGVRASMWEALLPLINTFPEVWSKSLTRSSVGEEEEEDSGSEGVADDTILPQTTYSAQVPSPGEEAYTDLLKFLQLGCLGSGAQSYPAIVFVISTIPPTILPYNHYSLEHFFNSFWAAYDSNALNVLPRDKELVLKSFLSAYLESVVLICKRLNRSIDLGTEEKSSLQTSLLDVTAATWIGRVLAESVNGNLLDNIPPKVLGVLLGSSIKKIEQVDSDVTNRAWLSTWNPLLVDDYGTSQVSNVAKLLASILGPVHGSGVSERNIKELLSNMIYSDRSTDTNTTTLTRQGQVLRILWELLGPADTAWLIEVTGDVLRHGLMAHLVSAKSGEVLKVLLSGLLGSQIPTDIHLSIWCDFLRLATDVSPGVLEEVLDTVQFSPPKPIQNSEFFAACQSWVFEVIQGNDEHLAILESIVERWNVCLNRQQLFVLVGSLGTSFIEDIEHLIFSADYSSSKGSLLLSARVLLAGLRFVDPELLETNELFDSSRFGAILCVAPSLGPYLPAELAVSLSLLDSARAQWIQLVSSKVKAGSERGGQSLIARLLNNCNTPLSASDVLDVAHRSGFYVDENDLLTYALPPQSVFDAELRNIADNPSSLLAEADPLVPFTDNQPTSVTLLNFDSQGLTKYPRITRALVSVLSHNRPLAKEQLWSFPHLLALQQLCVDFTSASSWPSDAFRSESLQEVQEVLSSVSRVIVYLENSLLSDLGLEWHQQLVARLNKSNEHPTSPRTASDVVSQIYDHALHTSAPLRDIRILRRMMQMILRDADPAVLDVWAGLAQSIQHQHPLPSIAIGSIVAFRGGESPRLDRWRNELASRIAGVSIITANSTGIPLLRMLNSIAPPTESGIVFLPQQRAVYLMQALQKWMSSDEDLDESFETHATVAIYHLLPILQTVPGAHWEFIFDILESNLVDGETSQNLYLLLQSLRAVNSIHELAASNKALQEVWRLRPEGVFESVLSLFLLATDEKTNSETRDKYHLCLVECMRSLSPGRMKPQLFDQLLSLIASRDVPIKAMAYELARRAVAQITEQRVIEAAMVTSTDMGETEPFSDKQQYELPQSLIARLAPVPAHSAREDQINLLLSWWIAVEFFDGSSLKVKQGYLEQLRRLDLVKTSLLPCLFELLSIGLATKPFGLFQWHVEEYYFDLYDDSLSTSLNIIAAHIYYKALRSIPGLIRNWWSECQDKQLASALATYTRTHFSPVLIKQELAQFRSSAASATEALNDDAFSVKVAPSVNEISAVYAVDDQALEIAVRLPLEFPLKAAEVRDVRGISGMENRRRAWVFGVQQTAQQGLIYDALSVYKKNVAGHFEGKSECAICYSLVSVTDRTLPTKPCRTCKNRFHASCLYKWFNTSHSSTCPLCRSDIF